MTIKKALLVSTPAAALLCYLAWPASSSGQGTQQCEVIGAQGFFDVTGEVQSESVARSLQRAACSEEIQTAEQAESAAASAGLGYGIFDFDAAATESTSGYQYWKSSHCGQSAEEFQKTSLSKKDLKKANTELAKVYSECVSSGLFAEFYRSPSDPETLTLNIRYKAGSGDPAHFTAAPEIVPSPADCTKAFAEMESMDIIAGGISKSCRIAANQGYTVSVNTDQGKYTGYIDPVFVYTPQILPVPPDMKGSYLGAYQVDITKKRAEFEVKTPEDANGYEHIWYIKWKNDATYGLKVARINRVEKCGDLLVGSLQYSNDNQIDIRTTSAVPLEGWSTCGFAPDRVVTGTWTKK